METDFIDAQFYLCHNMSFISYKTGSQHGHSRTGKQLPLNSGARATLREIKWAMRADQRSYQDPPNLLVVVHSRLQGTCVNSKMVSCDKGHQRLRPPSSFSAAVNDIFFFGVRSAAVATSHFQEVVPYSQPSLIQPGGCVIFQLLVIAPVFLLKDRNRGEETKTETSMLIHHQPFSVPTREAIYDL